MAMVLRLLAHVYHITDLFIFYCLSDISSFYHKIINIQAKCLNSSWAEGERLQGLFRHPGFSQTWISTEDTRQGKVYGKLGMKSWKWAKPKAPIHPSIVAFLMSLYNIKCTYHTKICVFFSISSIHKHCIIKKNLYIFLFCRFVTI